MGRPPSIPVEKKTRIVLSVLAGEMTIAEAARREKVSEQSIGRWKADFLEGGKTALVAGKSGPSSREEQLEAEVVELTQALGEAAVEIRVWKKSAEGRPLVDSCPVDPETGANFGIHATFFRAGLNVYNASSTTKLNSSMPADSQCACVYSSASTWS